MPTLRHHYYNYCCFQWGLPAVWSLGAFTPTDSAGGYKVSNSARLKSTEESMGTRQPPYFTKTFYVVKTKGVRYAAKIYLVSHRVSDILIFRKVWQVSTVCTTNDCRATIVTAARKKQREQHRTIYNVLLLLGKTWDILPHRRTSAPLHRYDMNRKAAPAANKQTRMIWSHTISTASVEPPQDIRHDLQYAIWQQLRFKPTTNGKKNKNVTTVCSGKAILRRKNGKTVSVQYGRGYGREAWHLPVSYTHLTLPTKA